MCQTISVAKSGIKFWMRHLSTATFPSTTNSSLTLMSIGCNKAVDCEKMLLQLLTCIKYWTNRIFYFYSIISYMRNKPYFRVVSHRTQASHQSMKYSLRNQSQCFIITLFYTNSILFCSVSLTISLMQRFYYNKCFIFFRKSHSR